LPKPFYVLGGVIDVATEHQHTIKQQFLFGSGLELVLIGFMDALLVHMRLFYLLGANLVIVNTLAADRRPGFHPHRSSKGDITGMFAKSVRAE
jgi:hypothetical protein